MIIFRLSGGLGNQLNIYNLSLFIKNQTGQDILYDVSLINKDWQSILYLKELGISLEILESKFKYDLSVILQKNSVISYDNSKYYLIDNIIGHPYQFFNNFNGVILNDTIIAKRLRRPDYILLDEIQAKNSVSVHIRRGDYINVKDTSKKFGVLSSDYYKQAINYINSHIENPKYYFFSDDPQWVKNNFAYLENKVIVEHNKSRINHSFDKYAVNRLLKSKTKFLFRNRLLNAINDFYLMMNCKHLIIANSTFSWWSAFLNNSQNHYTICPRRWSNFRNSEGTVPESWILI